MSSEEHCVASPEIAHDELNVNEENHPEEDRFDEFNYKESDAFKLVTLMCINENGTAGKRITNNMLKSIVNCVVASEQSYGNNLNMSGYDMKCVAQIYKFIQDHMETFQAYYNSGTRIIMSS